MRGVTGSALKSVESKEMTQMPAGRTTGVGTAVRVLFVLLQTTAVEIVEMVSKPKNAVGDRHLTAKSMHLATNLEFGRSHQMNSVACSNASSAECNISVYFFPVPQY